MKITRTDMFKKDYLKLPANVRKAAARQITQLLIDHTHPSLRMEGIKGINGVFSVRVDRRYRIAISFQGIFDFNMGNIGLSWLAKTYNRIGGRIICLRLVD